MLFKQSMSLNILCCYHHTVEIKLGHKGIHTRCTLLEYMFLLSTHQSSQQLIYTRLHHHKEFGRKDNDFD